MKTTHLTLSLLVLAGCGDATVQLGDTAPAGTGSTKQAEAWSAQDNPALFTSDLELTLANLPVSGEAQNIPWAGSYWPVYEDSINYKWDGANSESASAKYGRAFNVADLENKVSRAHGIDAHSTATECTDASVCDSSKGETCAKRAGQEKGRCIPTWWGICHAWTPASILLPEPKHPVTKNGVTFKVQDLKALASLVHNSSSSKFVSLRCNTQGGEVAVDTYGRVVANECRDTNAGTYHVLLANYLGLRHQAFAEDRVYDFEVWNQPLRGFRVVEKRDLSLAEANQLLGVNSVGGTTVTKSGTVAKGAWEHYEPFAVTAGGPVKVVMSGSGDADVYVKFGAQPTAQAYDCRPYAGGTAETCELTVPAGQTQVFVSVNGYADTSSFNLSITTGGAAPATWQFNAKATAFVYVKSEVSYISEASSQTDGNLSARIDSFTRTDRYEYILELDAAGKVVGGEWVGASKQAHPDFLWLPTGVRTTTVAGGAISYQQVKDLVMESVQEPGTGDATTEQTKKESGTVAKDEWTHFGPFDVAAGAKLQAVMTGTGDADLYVRQGLSPTAAAYDCRPYKNGSAEECTVTGGGPVYVSVAGYAASSTFALTITWRGEGAVTPPPPAVFTHLNVTGDVAQGELKLFTLAVPAGKKLVVRTTAPNDIDLYVKADAPPTTTVYDQRGYTATGNETLTVTAATDITLHLGVHGYAASSFTLTTSDE